MIGTPKGFADWACDKSRSLEERFGAELLIELTAGLWKKKHGIQEEINYQAEQLRKKERSLNPAHEPNYLREDAEHAEEVLPELKQLSFGPFDDRPLRDLTILRFCPPLEMIELRRSEIRDWSPFLFQTSITTLHVWGEMVARDLRVLGKLTRLQSMRLYFGAPWPDLRGMENLSELRELHFHGNILALREIPELPQVRHFEIHHGYSHNIPLRTVADLPEMPELRHLFLENTTELNGIERYKKLRNLTVFGYFTDLTPLAELTELTHLLISGGDYPNISPLEKSPNLCRLIVRHELPPDLTPMAEAPRLHEIAIELSPIVPPELASLNAMFAPWSDEFAVAQPRALPPLKLFLHPKNNSEIQDDTGGVRRNWDDPEMEKSEARWFAREINRRLNQSLGDGWGEVSEYGLHAGFERVDITRPEDIDRLPEIVQSLRQLIASARHPWQLMFNVDNFERFERDIKKIYQDDGEEFDAERQREEWEYTKQQQREHKKFLERKYRLRLQQQLGTQTAPENFTAESPPAEMNSDNWEPPAVPVQSESEYDLGTHLHFLSTITEKGIYIYRAEDRGLAELLLEIKAEF
jgi:hypothetical protein